MLYSRLNPNLLVLRAEETEKESSRAQCRVHSQPSAHSPSRRPRGRVD